MNDTWPEAHLVSQEATSTVREPLAEALGLAASIEAAVQQETGWGVQDLCVEVNGGGVLLTGRCSSYYCKQLAQHAAMRQSGGDQLTNQIEVLLRP